MDTCLWYLDSGCSRHMTGDWSLFNVLKSKKGGNVTFGDGNKSQIKGKGTISLPGLPDIANALYVEGLRVNLLSISESSISVKTLWTFRPQNYKLPIQA